jgi:hypothetical protein
MSNSLSMKPAARSSAAEDLLEFWLNLWGCGQFTTMHFNTQRPADVSY